MAVIAQFQRVIRQRVTSYDDECELWKSDHHVAMRFFDFCDLLRDGLELYREICRLDENWRLAIFRNEIAYDQEMHEKITDLLRHFSRAAFSIEAVLLPILEGDCGADHAREFRACCKEMRGMLTSDDQFFVSDRLAALRDDALDQHARGETSEFTATE